MSTIYDVYSDYVASICSNKNLKDFKSNPNYLYMLEHISKNQGQQYLNCITEKTALSKDDIIEFCTINDKIGKPITVEYPFLQDISVSPSSLRYIYHAHLILSHMKRLGESCPRDIVEIGGGYGGLCLAIHHFAPRYDIHINSYTICDLTNIIRLQEMYLNEVNPQLMKVHFVDAAMYGKDIPRNNMFLISNYCLSEISMDHQIKYREILFPKVKHGFFVWNAISLDKLGLRHLYNEPEIPVSGNQFNKYVWF